VKSLLLLKEEYPGAKGEGGRWLIGYLINIMFFRHFSLINHPGHPPFVSWPPLLQKEGRVVNIKCYINCEEINSYRDPLKGG
jgi:hypothetical protein